MLEPLTAVAVASLVLVAVSLVLARIIPDNYDLKDLRPAPIRRR
jgi:hypothetical protein